MRHEKTNEKIIALFFQRAKTMLQTYLLNVNALCTQDDLIIVETIMMVRLIILLNSFHIWFESSFF